MVTVALHHGGRIRFLQLAFLTCHPFNTRCTVISSPVHLVYPGEMGLQTLSFVGTHMLLSLTQMCHSSTQQVYLLRA